VSDQSFGDELDFQIPLSPEGNRAFFGRNVLQGLTDGIDDFVHERQPRWERRSYRVGAPVMLGCSPWINYGELLRTIEKLPGACVVLSKQPHTEGDVRTFARLRELNERTSMVQLRALTRLATMAPLVDGKPKIVGPSTNIHGDHVIPTFRTIGYRKRPGTFPPIAHAKLVLLGTISWTDEDPVGGVTDHVWFNAKRLWVSSDNFTYGSRRSLEIGYWTEDAELVDGVERFLVKLIGASEDLDALSDTPDPELAEVEFDDDAMAEAAAESYFDDEEW